MAMTVVVPGPVLVRSGTGSAGALEDLGYSVNGIDVDEEMRTLDVPGDEHGGEAGIPIEEQYLGEFHILRMELSRFDTAVLAKIGAKLRGGTTGTLGTMGTLFGASGSYYRILLLGAAVTRNYLACRPLRISAPYGTRYLRVMAEFLARPSGGVLMNSTTTG